MTATGPGGKASAPQYLSELDDDWRQRLQLVSLVAEVLDAIPESDCATALKLIGDRYAALESSDRERLLRRWPAVHVVITAYVAAERYDHGSLWPQLRALVGTNIGQSFNDEWGVAFLRNLEALNMPTFLEQGEEAGQRFVGRMLLHSGVPTQCLYDYFRIVTERRYQAAGRRQRTSSAGPTAGQ